MKKRMSRREKLLRQIAVDERRQADLTFHDLKRLEEFAAIVAWNTKILEQFRGGGRAK